MAILRFRDPKLEEAARPVIRRAPLLEGAPITIRTARALRDRRGPVHAGSFIRQRIIAFDCVRSEFPRVLAHELFHFVWVRAGNPIRRKYEDLVRSEMAKRVDGELGWSAEWRKTALQHSDVSRRTRRWREYCCESFCDTAAWLYAGLKRHPEFTLPAKYRKLRQQWFARFVGTGPLPI